MTLPKSPITAFKKELSSEQHEELIRILKTSFDKNMNRSKGLKRSKAQVKLEINTEKLWSLTQ